MKKQLLVILTLVAALSTFLACNNDDNNGGANPIIGTWKLVEQYRNGNSVVLSNCAMEETYIFGPEQFTHELYENSNGRLASPYRGINGDDDGDDDHGDDDGDDDHGDDDSDDHDDAQTDDSTDDSDDDHGSGNGGSGSGSCVNSDRVIGTWTSNKSVYSLTEGGATQVVTITFIDANNRFYVETTTTTNGTTVVNRYVYQKQ